MHIPSYDTMHFSYKTIILQKLMIKIRCVRSTKYMSSEQITLGNTKPCVAKSFFVAICVFLA